MFSRTDSCGAMPVGFTGRVARRAGAGSACAAAAGEHGNMKLPNGVNAVIDIEKLRDYCLSAQHPTQMAGIRQGYFYPRWGWWHPMPGVYRICCLQPQPKAIM